MKKINEKLLNYALESLLKDKISVIPVGKNKIPLMGWKEFQQRFATEDEVRGWFERFDDPQIGFVTGKISNLLVIDIEKGGDPSFLPQETMIIGTGGGGYHYYFKYEDGIMNKARIRPLTDWRGEGGYVVSPYSVTEKGPYSILQKAEWQKFPKELFPAKVDVMSLPATGTGGSQSFAKRDLNDYPGYGTGQRNAETARYIGYVLTQIHPNDWDSEGWQITQRANERNTPPLPQNELRTTFESIKRVEKRNNPFGRSGGPFTPSNSYASSTSTEGPVILEEENDEIKHIAEVADEQKIKPGDIYPLQMPCFDDVINGGVSPGDLITVAGQSGHGKTSLVQDWTISLIRGDKKPKSLWFSYEVLPTHLWSKFQEMGMTREDCAFIPCKHSSGNVAWVEQKIKEGKEKFGIKMVMIDHLGFLLPKTNGVLGKNMASNYAMFLTQVVRDLKTIALREEVIIFLPVHMKKVDSRNKQSDINDIKDSSGIGQESDLVFLIEREKDKATDAKSYFTNVTKITLAKNRKTGTTVVAKFTMVKGRFAYDNTDDNAEKAFEEFGKVAEEKPKVEIKQQVALPVPYQDKSDDDDDDEEIVVPGW